MVGTDYESARFMNYSAMIDIRDQLICYEIDIIDYVWYGANFLIL